MNCVIRDSDFLEMERLPMEICLKIFCFLDYQHLAVAQQEKQIGGKGMQCLRSVHGGSLTRISEDKNAAYCPTCFQRFLLCRKWKLLASDNALWSNLFKERWGEDRAVFYAPLGSKSWKDVFEVQDRCDRVGVGLKIIREGYHYYLVHQGEIQRCLGSRKDRKQAASHSRHTIGSGMDFTGETSIDERSCRGILDKILFFIGDLEVASADAKRSRVT